MPNWKKIIVSGSDAALNSLSVTTNVNAQSITGSLFGTASYALQTLSASYAVTASHALNASVQTLGSTLYSVNPSTSNITSIGAIVLGSGAGSSATSADYSVFLGGQAGSSATNAQYSVFIGGDAGNNGTNAEYSNFIGFGAGAYSPSADTSNFIGYYAGNSADYADHSNFMGNGAGYFSTNASYSNFIGNNAGAIATDANFSNFIGDSAGISATSATNSNFIGTSAGSTATNAEYSNFIGYQAGIQATNADNSNFIGQYCGYQATNGSNSNFIGGEAGYQATNAKNSNFIGLGAGYRATNASHSIFLGTYAGSQSTNAANSIIIGRNAGYQNNINVNNILIGTSVTLPISSSNAINIAGLIFGTGSYSNETTTSSGSANGRIGINQPNPQYSFDVSGSGNYTNNLYVTGSSRVTGSATINNYTLPITDGVDGQVMITDGSGLVTFDDIKVYAQVKNISGTTLYKGTPLHATASASPPSGNISEVIAASASLAAAMPATFILAEDLNNGEEGRAISVGYISGVNTSGFTVGDVVYVGVNGGYTNIKPTGSNLIQNLGVVTRVDASNGAGFIYGSGRTNAVPNLLNGEIFWGEGNTAIQKPLSDVISGSNFQYSGSFTGSLLGTASLSISSSYYPVSFTGSSLVSSDTSGINTTSAVVLGAGAGQTSTNSTYLIAIGAAAGQSATTSPYGVMIGVSAGNQASNAEYAVMVGRWAGTTATNASSSVMIGREAGRLATNTKFATFLGPYAGYSATNAAQSIFAGYNAGYSATNANDSSFIGVNAGYAAINANQSLFYGSNAGYQAAAATLSVFIGNEAGRDSISGSYSVFIGNQSGNTATSASFSTFIGRSSGYQATKANQSVFLGSTAGQQATFANNATFVGYGAGETAASASYSILIGNYAGATSTAANTIGSHNTIIGNGISVPINAKRALNINGLIFGTGSYESTTLSAFSGSANGRIGINQPNPQKSFDVSGSVRVSSLATGLTAPTTSGTTKMVITDSNGDLSFTDVPAGGSITIADEGTAQGTATFLNFTGAGVTATVSSNTASISITGGSGDAFPYTGSAQITGSLGITGSLLISQSLFQYSDNTDVDTGTETVLSIATGSYRSAFFDYVAVSGSNARSGTVMSVWNGANVEYTEASTNDIGTTTNCNLQVILSGANVVLQSRVLSDNWSVKSLVRML